MFSKTLFLLFLCGANNIVNSFVDIKTLHLADFIEFHSSLSKCRNSNSLTEELEREYAQCFSKNLSSQDKDGDSADHYKLICSNESAYRKCWEPVIRKSKECNSANGKGYPTSFGLVAKAVCKNDRGRSFISAAKKSMKETEVLISGNVDKDEICTASGEHWMIACKAFDIDSPNVCKKHSELNKCIEKIICKEIPMGRLMLKVYREAGQIHGCSSRNATVEKSTTRPSTRKPFYFI